MGRTAGIANEACPGGNVISVFSEQSMLQKSNEAWSEVEVVGGGESHNSSSFI